MEICTLGHSWPAGKNVRNLSWFAHATPASRFAMKSTPASCVMHLFGLLSVRFAALVVLVYIADCILKFTVHRVSSLTYRSVFKLYTLHVKYHCAYSSEFQSFLTQRTVLDSRGCIPPKNLHVVVEAKHTQQLILFSRAMLIECSSVDNRNENNCTLHNCISQHTNHRITSAGFLRTKICDRIKLRIILACAPRYRTCTRVILHMISCKRNTSSQLLADAHTSFLRESIQDSTLL